MSENEIRTLCVDLLYEVYMKIPWVKVKVSSPVEFFTNRVLSATRKSNLEAFLHRLCTSVHVTYPGTGILEYIEGLKSIASNDREIIDQIHNECIPMVVRVMAKKEKSKKCV